MISHPQAVDLKGRVAVLTLKNALLTVRQIVLILRAPLILEGVAALAVVDPKVDQVVAKAKLNVKLIAKPIIRIRLVRAMVVAHQRVK